jgi:hypothetical protein
VDETDVAIDDLEIVAAAGVDHLAAVLLRARLHLDRQFGRLRHAVQFLVGVQ